MDSWTVVKKKPELINKIQEPCWFYNNGKCRHKNGVEKTDEECKYLHVYTENIKRPIHLCINKPCDKYHMEGECLWTDNCKYSHKPLTQEEWYKYYPTIPFGVSSNVTKRLKLEEQVHEIDERIKILEYKQKGISNDIKQLETTLQQFMKEFALNARELKRQTCYTTTK